VLPKTASFWQLLDRSLFYFAAAHARAKGHVFGLSVFNVDVFRKLSSGI
jgi:hypothetical protein